MQRYKLCFYNVFYNTGRYSMSDEPSSRETNSNLQVVAADAQLLFQGWHTMLFQQDDDDDDDNGETVELRLENMEEFEIDISSNISISMVQASSAFLGTGRDDTGCVLWGASVCLAKWLAKTCQDEYYEDMISLKDAQVLELGCGGGLPSLVAKKLGAFAVTASDSEAESLKQLSYHASLNQCNIQAERIDWEDLEGNTSVSLDMDVILASDVIYSVAKVPALVDTIQYYLPGDKEGIVVVATRDGRRGIPEFLQAMENASFSLVEQESFVHRPEDAPDCFFSTNDSLARWTGDHTIYVFQQSFRIQGERS